MNLIWIVLGALVGGLLVGGDAGTGDDGAEPRTLVVTWSQATYDVADLDRVVGRETLVVETAAERADLLARVPDGLSTAEVEAVDLTTHVLVAGGYHRCTESSRVVETADGYSLEVSAGDESVACAWSPWTIDVWAVERPEPRTLVASWSQESRPDTVGAWRVEPRVVGTDADRDRLVATAPAGLREELAEVVAPVDLATHVVVVGGYLDCQTSSRVGPGPSFEVVEQEPAVLCDRAPYTVDVHVAAR